MEKPVERQEEVKPVSNGSGGGRCRKEREGAGEGVYSCEWVCSESGFCQ